MSVQTGKHDEMQTTVYGKVIIAGEHAVLRGSPALVFPLFARKLELKFQSSDSSLSVSLSGPHGDELKMLFWGVMEKAFEMTGLKRDQAKGHFEIESSIPVGAGMGASAALCVGIGRWFEWKNLVSEAELPEFCRQLENLFHGESSGVDIAVALSGQGLRFVRNGRREFVSTAWKPAWYVSYSGKRGITSECIEKIKILSQTNPTLALQIDEQMKAAVLEAETALSETESEASLALLAGAIDKARRCFLQWGLAHGEVETHMALLTQAGAIAVKPTGSGDGGYVLSLWRTRPPENLASSLLPL